MRPTPTGPWSDPWSVPGGPWVVGDPGESTVAVVCCLHGDEPCGKLAVERVVAEHGPVEGVTFVLAHPRAYERGVRCLDEDLNRAFPGDPGADSRERRLAARLLDALSGQFVLDVHSTVSRPTPFALVHSRSERALEAARHTGADRLIDVGFVDGGMIGELDGVAVEVCGTDRRRGTEAAYRAIVGFLAGGGLVDAGYRRSDPVVYRVDGVLGKPPDGLELRCENFERVGAGEVYADGEDEVLRAERPFYPVLASETGYDGMYGFTAVREGRLSGSSVRRGTDAPG